MKFTLYLDDFVTERIFSYLRWLFLLVCLILFYVEPISNFLEVEHRSFPILLTIGVIYIVSTHIALHRMDSDNKYFSVIIKSGIIFDYIAFNWVLVLTGGVSSPLFPIAYLVIMHSTVYWRTKGSFLSTMAVTISYSIIFISAFQASSILLFCLNLCFVWVVGLFGSMIVLRERKHFKQKKLFYNLMVSDHLTGLYNHRSLQEELNNVLMTRQPFILIMGDIDYFKVINDRYGHLVGDHVLTSIGKVFQRTANKYDGKAFRYGGEEFTFIFPNYSKTEMIEIFNELYKELNELSFTCENWKVTMSFGVSYSTNVGSRDELLANADRLLYEAKNRGKNQVIFDDGFSYLNHLGA